MYGDVFFGFFNKCFHCVISAQKALFRASGIIRCTSACGRFRVWLHLRHVMTVCRHWRRLPLVAICAAWRADQVLYGSCTIGVYNDDAVRLCVFTQAWDYRSWRLSEIEEFLVSTVDLSSSVRYCKCFSDRNPQIRLRFERLRKAQNNSYYVESMHMPGRM